MTEELLPCPFCGGKAEEWKHRIDQGGDGCTAYNVGCKNKSCLGMLSASMCGPWGYRKSGDLPDNETARAVAIEKWNTRPTADKTAREYEECVECETIGQKNCSEHCGGVAQLRADNKFMSEQGAEDNANRLRTARVLKSVRACVAKSYRYDKFETVQVPVKEYYEMKDAIKQRDGGDDEESI